MGRALQAGGSAATAQSGCSIDHGVIMGLARLGVRLPAGGPDSPRGVEGKINDPQPGREGLPGNK